MLWNRPCGTTLMFWVPTGTEPDGHAHVGVGQRGLDLRDGEAVRGQLAVVDLDLDLALQATRDADLADAGHRLQVGLDLVAGDVVELSSGAPVKAMFRIGEAFGSNLRTTGARGVGRQLADDRPHRLLDVDVGLVRVVAVGELDDDRCTALARVRGDRVDARDARDGVLDRLGDQPLDVFGRRIRPA